MICPVPLTLESGKNRIVSERFLAEAEFCQTQIADHQVTDNHRGFHHEVPFPVPAFAGARSLVIVLSCGTILLHPRQRTLEFHFVVNFFLDATDQFRHVHALHSHAKIIFKQILVHHRAGDAHGNSADRQIRLAANRGNGNAGLDEAENFSAHVIGNHGVADVLHVASVNGERWQSLLSVPGADGGKIDRAGSFRAVETPNRLGHAGIHVHCLRAVAPARRHRERYARAFLAEFFRHHRRLRHAADTTVGNYAFDAQSV